MSDENLINAIKELEAMALSKLDKYQKERTHHGEQFYHGYLTALLHIRGKLNEQQTRKEMPKMPSKPIC